MMYRFARSLLAVLGLVLYASSVGAGPDRFSVLLGSKHIGSSGFNEINPGLFATWERGRIGYSLGAYLNSYDRGSLAAVAHLPVFQWDEGALDFFGGLAWYPQDGHRFDTHIGRDIVGIGGVEIRHGHVFLQVLPMVTGGANGLVTFGLTWDVGQ